MYLREAIVLRINELCNKKNITINKLSTICGITQSTLANWKVREKTNVNGDVVILTVNFNKNTVIKNNVVYNTNFDKFCKNVML